MPETTANKPETQAPATTLIIADMGAAPEIMGLKPAERIKRQINGRNIGVYHEAEAEHAPETGAIIIVRNDGVYDPGVLEALIATPNSALVDDTNRPMGIHITPAQYTPGFQWLKGKGGELPAGIYSYTAAQLAGAYNAALRKREPPYCLRADSQNKRDVEWRVYMGAYKGVTDFVTKYVWPVPAFHVTRACIKLGLTPNMVTGIGAVLMLAAMILFWYGYFLPGLICGWFMVFLDTVDGKLARVTMTSTGIGNIIDHGIDLVHPPFWYIAWGYGLATSPAWLSEGLIIMFITYVAGRLCEGYFQRRHGFHVHVWRSFDSAFRLIVARRNPNLVILTLGWLTGFPAEALLLVIIWTVTAVPVHLVQIVQGETHMARTGRRLQSWLSA
jgi:phosphatidylglycerophosphate synthase